MAAPGPPDDTGAVPARSALKKPQVRAARSRTRCFSATLCDTVPTARDLGGAVLTDDIPADTGSADPSTELRQAAEAVRQRYRKGSPAYGFWRVIAGIWDRWAERMEVGVDLSPVAHAEFQAALFSSRRYMEMRHGGSEPVMMTGKLSCAKCGHEFATPAEENIWATELSARLLGHVCGKASHGQG
jgi:hypothetical protein